MLMHMIQIVMAKLLSAIFMASLSPAGSINGDTVGLTYASDILSEVPHYDTYYKTDVLKSDVKEMKYTEQFVSHDDSYDELTSDSNVISYQDYMVTIENDAAQYVQPPIQDNEMILSVIEQMKFQVEKYNTTPSVVSTTNFVATLPPPDSTGTCSSTNIDQDALSPSASPTNETTLSPITYTNVEQPNEEEDAEFDSDTFTNLFAPLETSSAESSLRNLETSNMHTFQQPHINTIRWTKDHPLVLIIDNPSKPVSTRCQLATNALWCYFHAFLVKEELKIYKETMKESSWIKAMQDEIHEFEWLKVWELVP
uniref:Integrase, catalytic region, zinc finger, CCHC-type, peptidase aspartic, catalytic n=1 Tax=Tanacetum cinerariifolium TaxID=118510 RepID=A0A699GXR3_TANCI|nr:hypothetical protein [Tanacetum cinerariifolium]